MKKGHAPGTRVNHRTHYDTYLRFCHEYSFHPLEADEWRYCQFAQYLHWQNKKPGTIENYVSTVRVVRRLQFLHVPEPGQIHYKLMSQAFKKARTEPVKQAAPMNHGTLLILFKQVNLKDELEVVAWVAVLVGFCLILRVSNLGPRTRETFDPYMHLTRGDLMQKKGFWSMSLRWTKTLQFRNRVVWAPLVPSACRPICPKHWVLKMIKFIPAEEHEPMFLVREGQARHPLTSAQVGRLLHKWAKNAGLDPGPLTPHCLRRGGLTWAHRAKLSGEALQILGDWASKAYMAYIDLDFDSRVESGLQMAQEAKRINKWQ